MTSDNYYYWDSPDIDTCRKLIGADAIEKGLYFLSVFIEFSVDGENKTSPEIPITVKEFTTSFSSKIYSLACGDYDFKSVKIRGAYLIKTDSDGQKVERIYIPNPPITAGRKL